MSGRMSLKVISKFLFLLFIYANNALANAPLKAIGLMSGTSMDGIDVCWIETDGQNILAVGKGQTYPYSPQFRSMLQQRILNTSLKPLPQDKALEQELTRLHAKAVQDYISLNNLTDVDLIGFHGHTLLHAPDQHLTYQIGDGQLLSKLTGFDVVYDFRSNDVAHGGQGAPFAPVYHQALAKDLPKPIAFVNIGGVSNITYIDDDTLIAFDTGPGNALLDDWIHQHTGQPYDKNGEIAARGSINQTTVDDFLKNPYFAKTPPKSLDRNTFKNAHQRVKDSTTENGAATLLSLTTQSIAKAQDHMPKPVKTWYICGGGRHNKTLMKNLQNQLPGTVTPIETIDNDGDFTEAQLMGFLAVRSKYNLPLSFPTTTGVKDGMMGGLYIRVGNR